MTFHAGLKAPAVLSLAVLSLCSSGERVSASKGQAGYKYFSLLIQKAKGEGKETGISVT